MGHSVIKPMKATNFVLNPSISMMKHLLSLAFILLSIPLRAQVSSGAGPDREICIYDTLRVTGQGLDPGDTGSYQWKDLNNGIVMSGTSQLEVKITSMPSRQYELKVTKVSSGNTYIDYDTFSLTVNALPTFAFKGLPPRCYDDGSLNLTAYQAAIAFSGDKAQSDSDLHYYQTHKNPSWIAGGPAGTNPYIYDFPQFITNSSIPKAGYRDTICYEYTDYKGCYDRECKPVRINPNPVVELRQGTFCQKAGPITLDKLIVAPFSRVGGIETFRVLEVPIGSGVDPSSILSKDFTGTEMDPGQEGENHKAGDYVVEYCFKDAITGCQSCDTTTVNVVKLPRIQFSAVPDLCINGPMLALDSFAMDTTVGKRLTNGQWSTVEYNNSRDVSNPATSAAINNSVKSGKYFNPGIGSGVYMVKLDDLSSGCLVSDSFTIRVNGLPLVEIQCLRRVCSNDSPFVLTNVMPSGTAGTWSGPGVANRKFNPGISPKTKILEGPYMLKYEYTHPLTGCKNQDTCSVMVETLPAFNTTVTPHYGSRYKVDFSLNSSLFNGKCVWYLGNGDTSTSVNPMNVVFTDSGTYTAYVYSTDGVCFASDSVTFTLDYHISNIDHLEKAIGIYPNPSGGTLNIEMPIDASAVLTSINGQVLSVYELHKGNNLVDLGYSKGIYILQIKAGDKIFRRKIVLE